jgi:hypothetical protein
MQTVQQLIELADSDRFEAAYDVAVANLVCAQGLPGSENLNIEAVVDWIADAARRVEFATQLNYPKFLDRPGEFANSQAIFCMATLMTVLQTELGVRYNPARIDEPYEFRDSRDRFIHGITHGDGGTCMTLPVLVAAVGRRLGYPIKLAKGTIHVFCRWDGGERSTFQMNDVFNIEATANGLVCDSDEHYLNWPYPPTDPVWDEKTYLKSLMPREELAMFFACRGFVLVEHGNYVQALEAYTCARRLSPDNMRYRAFQDLMFMLALDVPLEKPQDADTVLIGFDGRKYRPFHWPPPVENPERLPAAALPPAFIDNIIPPLTPEMTPGTVADALLPKLPQLMDSRWVEGVTQQIAMEHVSADAMRQNAMIRARHEAMLAEVDRINALNMANQQRTLAAMAAPATPAFPPGVSSLVPFEPPHAALPAPHSMALPSGLPPNNHPYRGYQAPTFPMERMQPVAIAEQSVRHRQFPLAFLTRAN